MHGCIARIPLSSQCVAQQGAQNNTTVWGIHERALYRRYLFAGLALAASWGVQVTSAVAEQYRYDDLGRLVSTTLDDGAVITYRYDAAGNRMLVASRPGDPDNDPPNAIDDLVSIDEDVTSTISPLLNDTDPQNQSLSLLSVGSPSHGIAVRNGNVVVHTPDTHFFGSDRFDYEVSDGQLSSTATVMLNIAPVNDPPVAIADSISTTEEVSITFDPRVNDTDVETMSGALLVVGKTNGSKGAVSIVSSGTRLRYTPEVDATGPDTFTYTIRDAGNETSTATVAMSITAENDPVNANDDSVTTQEDVSVVFDPLSNDTDPDGPSMTITHLTQGSRGVATIIEDGTRLHYRPNANAHGADSFSYTVSDGMAPDTATVAVTIQAVNDPPIAVDNFFADVSRDDWVEFNVLAGDSDPDGDAIEIVAVSDGFAGEARVSNNGQNVEYRYTAPFLLDADGFVYTIRDTGGLSATAIVNIDFAGAGGFPAF